ELRHPIIIVDVRVMDRVIVGIVADDSHLPIDVVFSPPDAFSISFLIEDRHVFPFL
ncbi:hypothetical protein GWN26_13770, partial [Candidatus Saccharibacteria bacterium]|nr:hypothetical protein [Candidatus Saccharibacteria bacterium]